MLVVPDRVVLAAALARRLPRGVPGGSAFGAVPQTVYVSQVCWPQAGFVSLVTYGCEAPPKSRSNAQRF
jgi:hypothetical protein